MGVVSCLYSTRRLSAHSFPQMSTARSYRDRRHGFKRRLEWRWWLAVHKQLTARPVSVANSKHWFTTSFLGGRCRKAMLGVCSHATVAIPSVAARERDTYVLPVQRTVKCQEPGCACQLVENFSFPTPFANLEDENAIQTLVLHPNKATWSTLFVVTMSASDKR